MQVSGAMSDVLVVVPSTATSFYRSSDLKSSSLLSNKNCSSYYVGKLAVGHRKSKSRGVMVRCCSQSRDNLGPVAPLELVTPAGQLLTQIVQTHPHLLPAAIDQQLENLQKDRDAQKEETPSSSQGLILYRRIAEVREKERRKALEEILYCLIVHKFLENNISMIPKISQTSDPSGRLDFWPNQEHKLESIHSPEAFEMIQSHLSLVLGDRVVGPLQSMVEISKVKLGKLYAASIMYGYFLRRVDQRYQLERAMKTLPEDLGRTPGPTGFTGPIPKSPFWDPESLIIIPADEDDDVASYDGSESYKLRAYVMYLDSETLQRYATIRSREAMSLIEKQTQALFGRPDIRVNVGGTLEARDDEIVSITFSGLTMLILEAVAFGSFLWDGEDYVEPKYSFINS